VNLACKTTIIIFRFVLFFRSGNVSQGAQELFQELPHEYVPPENLQKVAEHGGKPNFGSLAGMSISPRGCDKEIPFFF